MLGNNPAYVRGSETEPMSDEDFQSVVKLAITDAIQYTEDELGPDRAEATRYYHGEPFGNEMKGRSSVVLTEVRDGILGVIPPILRVLHGPEHTVEFVPRRGDAAAGARQATDYVRYVFAEDNRGFLVDHAVLKDGLLKRIGIVKWGKEEVPKVVIHQHSGLAREDLLVLLSDEQVQVNRLTEREDGLIDAEVRTVEREARLWVMPVPPDDFYWNREARSLDDCMLVGHRARLTRGELRAMGIPDEVIEEHAGTNPPNTLEEEARRTVATSGWSQDAATTPENEKVLYCESYFTIDRDGDGIAELRRICTIGEAHFPVKDVPADERPFALFCPDPEPHAMLGGSYFDRLKDMQKINSVILRTIFDSAAVAAFPRTTYVEGQVSVADILNTAIGAPIRMRQPGMVQPLEQPFTGEKLLPLLAFTQEVIERRTGNKGAQGLDMDALQSTGKEAVMAQLTANASHAELIARLYCEQVSKPMYRGLLKLACQKDAKARIIRLRGNYVEVDPRTWDADMDVSVNVALGSMESEKKAAVLEQVITDQSAILQQFGPANPVVTLPMLRNAKARLLELRGIKDVEAYYKALPDDWQPPEPPPPTPTPDELWIQAEKQMAQEKAMKELAIKEDELRLREREMELNAELKREEMALKRLDIETRAATDVQTTAMDNQTREKVAEMKPIPEVE